MNDQDEYALKQHELCCMEIGISERHDVEGPTLLEAVCEMKRRQEAIYAKALEIIPGYGNTGKSTFTGPIAVMFRLRDEVDLLRKELESEREKALEWFIAAQELKGYAEELIHARGRHHTAQAYQKLKDHIQSINLPKP
jgi:hypothetical protein